MILPTRQTKDNTQHDNVIGESYVMRDMAKPMIGRIMAAHDGTDTAHTAGAGRPKLGRVYTAAHRGE